MSEQRKPILNHLADGRRYRIGSAENTEVIFKADGAEVDNRYAIVEWWIEPDGPGVDAHIHETQDELIYVLEGTAAILIGEEWIQMEKGGVAVIPAGTNHGFGNDSDRRVGMLNIFLDGSYEGMMAQISALFANR